MGKAPVVSPGRHAGEDTRVSRGRVSAAGEQLTYPRLPTRVGRTVPPATRGERNHGKTHADVPRLSQLSLAKANICSYTSPGDRRVPRRAVPERAQPRQGHAFQLVAEPLHGVRSPLHVLLRPGLRAPRRPAGGRPLRHLHPSEDQRRRSPSTRAGPSVLGTRTGDDRRCDRSLPAGRGTLPPHPRAASRRWPKPGTHSASSRADR